MRLKNYQEDHVLRIIDVALEDYEDLRDNPAAIHDIAAYVLNRIPPRYIMSERGFTRLADTQLLDSLDNKFLVNSIQLVGLIREAIEVVQTRRPADAPEGDGLDGDLDVGTDNIHNFPQFVGRVHDARTGAPVYGAMVHMYIDGSLAGPAEPGWLNPYETQVPTGGLFSFWPAPVESGNDTMKHKVRFEISHAEYNGAAVEHNIETVASFVRFDTICTEVMENIGVIQLQPSS